MKRSNIEQERASRNGANQTKKERRKQGKMKNNTRGKKKTARTRHRRGGMKDETREKRKKQSRNILEELTNQNKKETTREQNMKNNTRGTKKTARKEQGTEEGG